MTGKEVRDVKHTAIQLPDEVVLYLQKLTYEANGLKVLHTHALNAGVPREKAQEIQSEFLARFEECELAKEEMWKPYQKDHPNAVWHLDFDTGILDIKERGEDAGR